MEMQLHRLVQVVKLVLRPAPRCASEKQVVWWGTPVILLSDRSPSRSLEKHLPQSNKTA